jgi:Ser/Thr protein kinase RdoA (MazF antagonist)
VLNERTIRRILERYSIGSLQKIVKQLDSGFQSDNVHIRTSSGDYVVRIIHDSEENVEFSMRVFEYLADHEIKTPRPARTQKNALTLPYDGKIIAIQSFIPGIYVDDEDPDCFDPLLPFYGREIGRIHQVTLKMVQEMGEDAIQGRQDTITYVKRASDMYMPDDDYVKHQYEIWTEEIQQLPEDKLTKAIVHGDVGVKDFFFNEGVYTGILDFNAAALDYLLFDVAAMMMYCDLIQPLRKDQYLSFITSYLDAAPIQKNELNWLHLILRTRWFVQVFYHNYRYVEGITQGLDTEDVDENLEGVEDGINRLRIMEQYSKRYFREIIDE